MEADAISYDYHLIITINLRRKLNHPNIVRLLGFFVKESTVYLVFTLANGGSLDKYLLNKGNQLTTNQLLSMYTIIFFANSC